MTALASLWLPILLSAVFVFVASSVIHMVLQLHNSDYRKVPDAARAALGDVPPGQYMVPHAASPGECNTKEMRARFDEGPVGVLVLREKGMPSMGKALGQWFALCLLVAAITAWLTGRGLAPGADGARVFLASTVAALLGHGLASVNDSIWKGVAWSTTAKFVFDGIVYALVTGTTFWWLWPAAGS